MKPSLLNRKLSEKFLYLRRSRKEGGMSESRLRCKRAAKNSRLWTLSVNYLLSLDVDKEVKVFQKICTRRGTDTGANWKVQV